MKHAFLPSLSLLFLCLFCPANAENTHSSDHQPAFKTVSLPATTIKAISDAEPSKQSPPLPQTKPQAPEISKATDASSIPEPTFSVSRKGDLEMSCTELVHEAKAMSLVIENTKRIKDNTDFQSNGLAAAGAVGSLLIGTATGGIGLAVGGLLLDHNIEGRKDAADDIQDIAAQRRTFMMGIHKAKDCDGDIKAMANEIPTLPSETSDIVGIQPAAGHETLPINAQNRYND